MPLTVTIDLPADLEAGLRRESANLDADVTEAYALELFRRGNLSHFELSTILGLDRFETDAYLKRQNVFEGSLMMADLERDRQALDSVMKKAR